MANLPTFTDVIDQTFFIEAQGGSQQPVSYLDRFPDAVYSKALDSILVTFMYALLGPVGIGLLREEYLEARLAFEEAGVANADLDSLYTHPFAFARLADETYDIDASANLLPAQDRAAILAADAAFRNRAMLFLKGARAGGTELGLSMVAQSGLNHPVDLIQNYKALFDQWTDLPLNLQYQGTTTLLDEIIVIPRKDIPTSAVQDFVFNGDPIDGWFTLTIPIGPPVQTAQIGVTFNTNIIDVPDASQVPQGVLVTIIGPSTIYAQAGPAMTPTSVQLVYPNSAGPDGTNTGTPGAPLFLEIPTDTYQAYFGNAQTVPLEYNSNYVSVQTALECLPVIGAGNIVVSGGPLPNQAITVRFTNNLADQPIPQILVNTEPDDIAGIGSASASPPLVSALTDVNNNTLPITSSVTIDVAGIAADSELAVIPPVDAQAMQVAVDQTRPLVAFFSAKPARSTVTRQPVNTIFGNTAYTEVLQYVTGQTNVRWPPNDGIHWIQAGVEHEAPRPVSDRQHNYLNFHNPVAAHSYTEGALTDPDYETPQPGDQPIWVKYFDSHVGQHSAAAIGLSPYLSGIPNGSSYPTSHALAPRPNPLVITDVVNGVGIINNEYPVDYLSLVGISPAPTKTPFWSSTERNRGADYIEVDLGTPQAINYLYFEAGGKPFTIDVAYDVLDQSPNRRFVPVTVIDPALGASTTSLAYSTGTTNPWQVAEIHFVNSLGTMVYTRFIRIGFTRNPKGTPLERVEFHPNGLSANFLVTIPYSLDVRNLRIGRSVS